jgi:hypothetical protein
MGASDRGTWPVARDDWFLISSALIVLVVVAVIALLVVLSP